MLDSNHVFDYYAVCSLTRPLQSTKKRSKTENPLDVPFAVSVNQRYPRCDYEGFPFPSGLELVR